MNSDSYNVDHVYRIDWENGNQYYTKPVRLAEKERVYAAGRLVFEGGSFVATDRLGSVVNKGGTARRYYPYGQEVGTATPNDVAKFGTYTRDASSGLDYAMNRYYQSWWGRFTSPDPYRASGGPADPGSWNRYAYVQGDPVNLYDPMGLQADRPKIITPPVTVVDSVTYLDTVMEFYNAEFGGFNGWTGGGGSG